MTKQPRPTHLDVKRSLVVSSPAGSGKTQKLAERYVALLESGVPVERILAITFTEKAAAEMKARVLKILRVRLPELHARIKPELSRFRISTVHAFARAVLERFAFELDLPPNLEIIDAIEAELMREEVIREGLIELGSLDSEASQWVRHLTLTQRWSNVQRNIHILFRHIPQSYLALDAVPADLFSDYARAWGNLKESWGGEFWQAAGFDTVPDPREERNHLAAMLSLLSRVAPRFLTQAGTLRKRLPKAEAERELFGQRARAFSCYHEVFWRWHAAVQTKGLLYVFRHLAGKYEKRKRERKVLDFGDLEHKLYSVLYHSSNWSNVLASFDEQTDHILLDEFQDTNGLQWAIVSKLIEEWRAGWGAKREVGKTPTIFLVGDVRQSIYLFRGANVEVFKRAARELEKWMLAGFEEVVVRENFRSLPLIVDFVNALFCRLMQGGESDWQTTYERFTARRERESDEYQGYVELLLTRPEEDSRMAGQKLAEAETVARRITELLDSLPVYDKDENDRDVERSCRFADIMILLRRRTHLARYEAALRRYNIPFVVVQGTGFHSSPEVVLLRQLVRLLANPADDFALYGVLRSALCGLSEPEILEIAFAKEGYGLWDKLCRSSLESAKKAVAWINCARHDVDSQPSAKLFERILRDRRVWSFYSDNQEAENIRKLLKLLEGFDTEGLSVFKISERLERMSTRAEEPKASVNTEGMDAVRIMTIHAAKGLDSRVVFVVGMDEHTRKPEVLAVREEGENVILTFTDTAYKDHPERLLWQAKQAEEQKRLFYVAATRARDALFLSGVWTAKASGWLSYLVEGLDMREVMDAIELPRAPRGVNGEVRTAEPDRISAPSEKARIEIPHVLTERNWSGKSRRLRRVTDDELESSHHGKGLRHFGVIMHGVLERISRGTVEISPNAIDRVVQSLVISNGLAPSRVVKYQRKVKEHLEVLNESGLLADVILPQENAESEVSFVLREAEETVTGRIDRVLIEPDGLHIIDYKSFSSKEADVSDFTEQLRWYAKAAGKLYDKQIKCCSLLFTADARLVEVNIV